MYYLNVAIENIPLRKRYTQMRCCVCGSRRSVAGHHILRKSKIILDIPENLRPLCRRCHGALHDGEKVFTKRATGVMILRYGKENDEKIAKIWTELNDGKKVEEMYRENQHVLRECGAQNFDDVAKECQEKIMTGLGYEK